MRKLLIDLNWCKVPKGLHAKPSASSVKALAPSPRKDDPCMMFENTNASEGRGSMHEVGRIERRHKDEHGDRHDHELGEDAVLVSGARPNFAGLFICCVRLVVHSFGSIRMASRPGLALEPFCFARKTRGVGTGKTPGLGLAAWEAGFPLKPPGSRTQNRHNRSISGRRLDFGQAEMLVPASSVRVTCIPREH